MSQVIINKETKQFIPFHEGMDVPTGCEVVPLWEAQGHASDPALVDPDAPLVPEPAAKKPAK